MKSFLYFLASLFVILILPFAWETPNPIMQRFAAFMVVLLGLFWVVVRLRKPGTLSLPGIFFGLLAFVILAGLSLLVASQPYYGFFQILFGLFAILVFVLVIDGLGRGWRPEIWQDALISMGVFYTFIALRNLLAAQQAWSQIASTWFSLPPVHLRVSSVLLNHPNLYASYLVLVIPIAILRLYKAGRSFFRVLWGLVVVFLIAGLYFSSSRGGFLGVASGLLVMALLVFIPKYWRRRSQERMFGNKRSSVLFGVSAVVIMVLVGLLVAYQTQNTLHGSISARAEAYLFALRQIASKPLLGHGAGAYPFLAASRAEMLGIDEIFHAHNLWLQIGVELGLVGILLGLVAVGVLGWDGWKTWQTSEGDPTSRLALIAYAGVGVGLLVQHMVDNLFWSGIFTIAVMVILGLFSSLVPSSRKIQLRPRLGTLLVVALLLVNLAGIVFYQDAFGRNEKPVDSNPLAILTATQSKWCRRAERYPVQSFTAFQCSLASAYLAQVTGDTGLLELADRIQRQGLAIDPAWYIHWANLASYEWQLGKRQDALEHMRRAAASAPNQAFLWLNLGWMAEQSDRLDEATEAYRTARCLAPRVAETTFFKQSPTRQQALSGTCDPQRDRLASSPVEQALSQGRQAALDGDLNSAEAAYRRAIQLDPGTTAPYILLAEVLTSLGRDAEARVAVKTGLFFQASGQDAALAARLLFQLKDPEQAWRVLEKSFESISVPLLSLKYYMHAYHQPYLATDLSPYLVTALLTPESEAMFRLLADHYEQTGEMEKASGVRQWLARVAAY